MFNKTIILTILIGIIFSANLILETNYKNSNFYNHKVYRQQHTNNIQNRALNVYEDFYGIKTDMKTDKTVFNKVCERIFDR